MSARARGGGGGGGGRLGVCSWSLQAGGPAELVEQVRRTGLAAVQIALDPLRSGSWSAFETAARLREAGIAILSGMMAMRGEDYSTLESIRRTGGLRPDEHWGANLEAARRNAALARDLGIDLVTFHAGRWTPRPARPAKWLGGATKWLGRVREVARVFAREGVRIGLETGQEEASILRRVLREGDLPGVGVNFDPANMILYGTGDPVEGLGLLAPHVVQIHVKDARPAPRPGLWGEEVPLGEGAVDWEALLGLVERAGLRVPLVVERESGDRRVEDIRRARTEVEAHLARAGGQG